MLFMMIGCVFLNCGLVGWSGRQIRMDAFVSLLPPALRSIVELVSEIVLMATSLLLAILAWPVVSMLAELDQRSQAANIPMVLPQAMMPIGFLLMACPDRRPVDRSRRVRRGRASKKFRSLTIHADGGSVRLLRPADNSHDYRPSDFPRSRPDFACRDRLRRPCADDGNSDLHVRKSRQFSAARRPLFRAGRRDHGARRDRATRRSLGGVDYRRHPRIARGHHGGVVGIVRRHGTHVGGHRCCGRPAAIPLAQE